MRTRYEQHHLLQMGSRDSTDASLMDRLKELEEENRCSQEEMYAEEHLMAETRKEALEGKF